MAAVSTFLSSLLCLSISSACAAGHPTDHEQTGASREKKIEIRVQVNGDDVNIEALEDGKQVDINQLGGRVHALLRKHMPELGGHAAAIAMFMNEDDPKEEKDEKEGRAKNSDVRHSIQKIIRIAPEHAEKDAEAALKAILRQLPDDLAGQVQMRKIVRMSREAGDEDGVEGHDERAEHGDAHHKQAQKQLKVYLRKQGDDSNDHEAIENKQMWIVRLDDDGAGHDMSWNTREGQQWIISPDDDKKKMIFMSAQPTGKYKLGVALAPLGELVRAQLRLEEGAGMAVENVMDDSAAEKAGLRRFDIIIKVDDKDVRDLSDLTKLVEKAGESNSQLHLRIVRRGERQTVTVTPEPNEPPQKARKSSRSMEWTEKRRGDSEEEAEIESIRDLKKELQELRALVEELKEHID